MLYRVVQDHYKESYYYKQETEEAYGVPDKAYSRPSFFPGNENRTLEHCRNNHTGKGKDKDKCNIKDLCNNVLLYQVFRLLNRSI